MVNVRRVNIDSSTGVAEVADTLSERDDGTLDGGSTKSDAGRRTVAIPALILPDLIAHLGEFNAVDLDAFMFLGENGGRLRRSNFRRATSTRRTDGTGRSQPR